jgi:hypothetical protein
MNIAGVTSSALPQINLGANGSQSTAVRSSTGSSPVNPEEGLTEDPSITYTSYVCKTFDEWVAESNRIYTTHMQNPWNQASESLTTVNEQLVKINRQISQEHPGIAAADWDFAYKDGKFAVSGLNAADTKWLENKLNGNEVLTKAVTTFNKATADFLETSDDNPAYTVQNAMTNKVMDYNFVDVNKQLNGKVNLKELISSVEDYWGSKRITGYSLGNSALEILASRLNPQKA